LSLTAGKKRLLSIAILAIAFYQMPLNALMPVINTVVESVFTDRTLAEVQTAFAFANFVMPVVSLLGAFLINRGVITKKTAVWAGLTCLGLSAVSVVIMHESFWQLYFASAVMGIGMGLFVPNAFGLLFDNFEPGERQTLAGYQTSCVNLGGIVLSVCGGLLGSAFWYGGYLLLAGGFIVAALVFIAVPNYRAPAAGTRGGRRGGLKLDPRVFYYCGIVFFFMLCYNAGGSNISTHISSGGMGDFTVAGKFITSTALAGAATAVQMAGGVVSGLFFGKLSAKFRDHLIAIAMCLIFLGFMVLSLFERSVAATFVAVFVVGMSISLAMPRCVFAVSTLVDADSSAIATSLVTCIAPSIGAFLSPVIITNLTTAIGGESTAFRYRFVGIAALLIAACIAAITALRTRRESARI